MKKRIVLVAILASLTGCAALDNQDASKGQKTAEAAGVGAAAGAIIGHFTGFSPTALAAFGGMLFGGMEYTRATNLEIAEAKKQADALKQAGIDSEVKTAKVEVKDSKGEMQSTTELKTFVVHSVSSDAVDAVAMTAEKSAFGGRIVIVSDHAYKSRIEEQIAKDVTKKNVTVAYFSPREAAKFGAKEGVAWVPVHPVNVADAGKKVRAS